MRNDNSFETMLDFGSMGYDPSQDYVLSIFDGDELPFTVNLREFNKNRISFGRLESNDIVLKSRLVSKEHGYFVFDASGCSIVDNRSTNGILVNGRQFSSQLLMDGDQIRIERPDRSVNDGVLILVETRKESVVWKSFSLFNRPQTTIGRDPSCDVHLDHLSVSRLHAIITQQGNQYVLTDNHSLNGVFINGNPVNGQQVLQNKDVIVITNSRLLYANGTLNYCSFTKGIGVTAADIVKIVGSGKTQKVICNHVSLKIEPGSFVGIIGGSGAGKTTFMNCLSGYNPATHGKVLINGVDLYANYSSFKSIIGYVPQQDIVHGDLPLEEMLDYAAQLRMPLETTKEERKARVRSVIETVELTGNENTMINRLSGGQRKRASIAVELLSDPKLFFLDEPSSGLDPGTEKNLMRTMHNMARQGITIILITHTIQNIHLFDKIIFLGRGGNLCYYGNPKGAERFFGVDNLADAYIQTDTRSPEISDRFRNSTAYNDVRGDMAVSASQEQPTKREESFGQKIRKLFVHIGTLTKRYAHIMMNDRQRMLLLLLQPPLLALLISMAKDGNQYKHRMITMSLLFALSCSGFWIGILNAIQEICKEKVILKRENMAGLSMFAYVTSKVIVLSVLGLFQTILLIVFYRILVGVPEEGMIFPPLLEMFITIYLTTLSAATLGLLVSSFFDNPDRALVIAPILIMPQILFSGILFDLEGVKNTISYFTTCRWTMKAFGITAHFNILPQIVQNGDVEMEFEVIKDIFEHSAHNMHLAWIALLIMSGVCYLLSYISLRVKKL